MGHRLWIHGRGQAGDISAGGPVVRGSLLIGQVNT